MQRIKIGHIYMIDFGPIISTKIAGKRPGLVVNIYGELIHTIPISRIKRVNTRDYKIIAGTASIKHDSYLRIEQYTTIDINQITLHIGLMPDFHLLRILKKADLVLLGNLRDQLSQRSHLN